MAFRDDLVARAIAEWSWFGKDLGRNDKFVDASGATTTNAGTAAKPNPRKETVQPYCDRVADYWLAISSADYKDLVSKYAKAKGKLDGTVDLAWSAAFISYCMQMAGAGSAFPYAPGHSTWIVKSIKNRVAGKLGAGLVGYRPGEIPLAVGDLIGKPREAGVTYDTAIQKGWFTSHSDIVVDIDTANKVAHVIGGNVGQTVGKSQVAIKANGALNDPGGWIVHIQNNIVAAKAPAVPSAVPAKVG
jgi:hypothetical protein